MEKKYKYICKRDLGEIMEVLAEEALNHADTIITRIHFHPGAMNVCVYMKESPYTALSEIHYDIIESIEDSTDAKDHIFGDALVALEKLTVIKTEETNI